MHEYIPFLNNQSTTDKAFSALILFLSPELISDVNLAFMFPDPLLCSFCGNHRFWFPVMLSSSASSHNLFFFPLISMSYGFFHVSSDLQPCSSYFLHIIAEDRTNLGQAFKLLPLLPVLLPFCSVFSVPTSNTGGNILVRAFP